MPVRFKCRSEYQKSYRAPRSRSESPQRCSPLAGLRSDQMGISREPGLQRRKRLGGPGGLAQSCSSLLGPPDPQQTTCRAAAPPAASRSHSAHRKEPSLEPNPPTPPEARADPGSPADSGPPAGRGPAADPGPSAEPGAAEKAEKARPSRLNSQSQPSRPLTAAPDEQQPLTAEVQHALRRRARLRTGGQRSGGHRSEYHRQFSWKKPKTTASPILTAEQLLHPSSRSVPPFKKHPVPMETEYRSSFQGLVPPAELRLRKHLEHQRVPLFHTQMTNKKRKEETKTKPRSVQEVHKGEATPPPQVHRGHRKLTEYQTSFSSPLHSILEGGGATDGAAGQAEELRQKALSYRRRAWGANFSRDHLNQLLSEHNALWEPTDTTESASEPPTPRLTFDLCHDPDGHSASPVEALDLTSSSSKRSSVSSSGNKNTQIKAQSPAERRTAWEEEEEDGNTDEREEGRLPTPRLKIQPVQRTHHDLTTPATGGAMLVGKLRSSDESSPFKQKEAWPESSPTPLCPASKPIRTKHTAPSPVAPPPLVPPLLHCIQGTLRHADFQHNGELGLRFRELQCSGGCGSDQDDRMSVMSWRSAASCSMASAVLERAQKRRENFWGKR